MTRREWTIDDRFGRTWRLVLEGRGAGVPGRGVMRTLADASLAGPPDRSNASAEALFAVAAAVGRDRDAYDDWLRLPLDEASRLAADVGAQLTRAESVGTLIAEPFVRVTRLHYDEEQPPSEKPPQDREQDAWIGIELVDEDGKPVPNVAYRIEAPNGAVYAGSTDASGRARVEGLDPGNCKISFPDVHGPDWQKVG